MANKYENAKIYKLVNNVDDAIYVGYTCQNLFQRLDEHKRKAKYCAKYNIKQKVYKHLNEIGWEHVDIVLIEKVDCDNEKEVKERERYWIEELEATLNKKIPGRERKEYCKDNKEDIAEYAKKYQINNREKIAERNAKYYETNKEKIKEKKAELIDCECGITITASSIYAHRKTEKHTRLMLKIK